jgi:hypothetical protein
MLFHLHLSNIRYNIKEEIIPVSIGVGLSYISGEASF